MVSPDHKWSFLVCFYALWRGTSKLCAYVLLQARLLLNGFLLILTLNVSSHVELHLAILNSDTHGMFDHACTHKDMYTKCIGDYVLWCAGTVVIVILVEIERIRGIRSNNPKMIDMYKFNLPGDWHYSYLEVLSVTNCNHWFDFDAGSLCNWYFVQLVFYMRYINQFAFHILKTYFFIFL